MSNDQFQWNCDDFNIENDFRLLSNTVPDINITEVIERYHGVDAPHYADGYLSPMDDSDHTPWFSLGFPTQYAPDRRTLSPRGNSNTLTVTTDIFANYGNRISTSTNLGSSPSVQNGFQPGYYDLLNVPQRQYRSYSSEDNSSCSESPATDCMSALSGSDDSMNFIRNEAMSPTSMDGNYQSSFPLIQGFKNEHDASARIFQRLDDISTDDKRDLLTLVGCVDIPNNPVHVATQFTQQLKISASDGNPSGSSKYKSQYGKPMKSRVSSMAGQMASVVRRKAEPSYFCELPNCGAGLTRKNGLINHYKSHLGIADKQCQFCYQTFTTSLGRHEKTCKSNPSVL